MGIRDRLGGLFGRRSAEEPTAGKPGLWRRITERLRRRQPPTTEPPEPPPPPEDPGIVDFGRSVRITIDGTFGSRSGTNIYAEWSGTIDTINGNHPPSAANAENLAAALAAQDAHAVIDAINQILTLDYAGQRPGGRGGFTSYSPDEGIRVIAVNRISITWT